MPCLVRGEQKKFGRAIDAGQMAFVQKRVGKFLRKIHFGGGFDALPRNIKQRDRTKRRFAETKTFGVLFPTRAQTSHDTRAGDNYARRRSGFGFWRKQHTALWRKQTRGVRKISGLGTVSGTGGAK